MMKKQISLFFAILMFFGGSISAQELRYDVELETYFDNREYLSNSRMVSRAGTDFAERFTPSVGYYFDGVNGVTMGVIAVAPFRELDGKLFDDVELLLYYSYDSDRWSAAAGFMPRSRMKIDSYSTLFFRDDYLFYDNVITGVVGCYSDGVSFVEFVCDWENQIGVTERERFRLMSAARYYWSKLYVGYNVMMTHLAASETTLGVVENIIINPRVGLRASGKYDFDMSLAYIQTMQQDRVYGDGSVNPAMGEVSLSIGRWGLTLSEQFYWGKNLMPLYDGQVTDDGLFMDYADLIYSGDPFFATDGGFYNRASLGYERRFFDEKVGIGAHFITHCDSEAFSTEQILRVDVKLGGKIYSAKKK